MNNDTMHITRRIPMKRYAFILCSPRKIMADSSNIKKSMKMHAYKYVNVENTFFSLATKYNIIGRINTPTANNPWKIVSFPKSPIPPPFVFFVMMESIIDIWLWLVELRWSNSYIIQIQKYM